MSCATCPLVGKERAAECPGCEERNAPDPEPLPKPEEISEEAPEESREAPKPPPKNKKRLGRVIEPPPTFIRMSEESDHEACLRFAHEVTLWAERIALPKPKKPQP